MSKRRPSPSSERVATPPGGVYVLAVEVRGPVRITVGSIGRIELCRGLYLYAGSAQRALGHRVRRHFKPCKPKRWHIDYLTAVGRVVEAAVWGLGRQAECELAREGVRLWGPAVEGFGCSDCRCVTHLIGPAPPQWRAELEARFGPADAIVAGDEQPQRCAR